METLWESTGVGVKDFITKRCVLILLLPFLNLYFKMLSFLFHVNLSGGGT